MTRIAVLVSGGGTNLSALLQVQARGELDGGEIVLVISSRSGVKALETARLAGLEAAVISGQSLAPELFDGMLCSKLELHRIDLVILAGFLKVLGPQMLGRFRRRIINVHPSLLPAFGGAGMYGLRVHEAALNAGVKITGATVHFVEEAVDGGEIILQKAVEALPGDTPETLQRRVMEQAEWILLPRAAAMFCRGEIGPDAQAGRM